MHNFTPLFLIVSCSAPELAPQTDLAGAQPIASGPLIEETSSAFPVSAWTAAVPLTLVAPGGKNLAVLDKLGVRVEVLQVRQGRILVNCTGCEATSGGAEGWMPKGVLWGALPAPETKSPSEKDPLSLALGLRSQWMSGLGLPEGVSGDTLCAIADQGWTVTTNQAVASHAGGEIKLQRRGSEWTLTSISPPPTPIEGSCG